MELAGFVRDARRMINIFALPISQSAPHIYISMLPLMADKSRVSAHYLQRTSSLVRVTRIGVKRQSPLLKLLKGHTDWAISVDFSSDGSLIVSGSDDGTVRIWDTEKGELTAGPFDGHVGQITSISFSPDDMRIVVGGWSGISVLDVESGSIVVGPFGDKYTLTVAVSPDGKHIISAASNFVSMWDLESGMINDKPFVGRNYGVSCAAYSRDGHFIVSGSSGSKSVCIWDVESRRPVREPFVGHMGAVYSVSFSPDGKYVVSGSYDADIRIWDVEGGEVDYSPLTGHKSSVNSVAYSSDGTWIVSGSEDRTVRIWNAQNGQLVAGPFKHTKPVECVAFLPDGTRVVSGCERTLRIWDVESGKIDSNSGPERIHEVRAVRFSADGTCVISEKGTRWRIENGAVISEGRNRIKRQTLAVTDSMHMQFSFENTLEWNPYTGKVTSASNGKWGYPNCIAVSPNGKRIAFSSWGGTIRVWDRERDVLVCGPFKSGYVNSLTFSLDGKHIASGGSDIRVWNAETGELTGKLLFGPFDSRTFSRSIAYRPRGRHVASGYTDNTVRIRNLETGRYEVFEGHTGIVESVAYSPDGSLLVSSSDNGEIRIWNASTSETLVPMDQDQLNTSSNIELSKLASDKDGWIRGAHDELLLWVPLDIRATLCFFPNIAIINNKKGFSTALDFSSSAQGERWHECFHPLE